MTLDEQRRMNMLEATLREIRRIKQEADQDPLAVPFEDALEGDLLKAWRQVMKHIDLLIP